MRHVAAVPCLVGVLITNSRFPQLYCDSRLSHPHTLSDVSCSVMFFCFVKFHFYLSNGLSLAAHQILEAGHILYMLAFYRCCCPSVGLSVCRSVTLMHVTQLVKIFRCFSMPLGTLAIHWHRGQFYGDCPRGTPPSGELNARVVAKYSDFGPIERYNLSRKRCKIGGKLVLITNRKSYMSFRLVPKSVTLNDLEQRNGPYYALFNQIR